MNTAGICAPHVKHCGIARHHLHPFPLSENHPRLQTKVHQGDATLILDVSLADIFRQQDRVLLLASPLP